ncbi:MAG: hemolysin family protein [Candidatus Desulfofervidus auxilii]|nr:hemolysin family protein [Candidatus Desulfofervidus auxilii]
MNPIISLIIFFTLLLLEGFFSGSEIALVSADLRYLRAKGAKKALKFLEKPSSLFGITLLGTNLSVIINTALTTSFLIQSLGNWGEILSIVSLPPIFLIFGEIVPKTICRQYANLIAPKSAYGLKIASFLLAPLVLVLSALTNFFLKLAGAKENQKIAFFTKEELKFLIQKNELEIKLTQKERNFLSRLFTFTEIDVKRVMIPLMEVISISDKATLEEAIGVFNKYLHTRLPVYKERVDHIVGIIHYLDLINLPDLKVSIKPYIKPAFFVPETKPVHQLLKEMQQKKQPLAVVVDEYGGAVGIVTIKDLVEEITGEILGEDERIPEFFQKLEENRYLIKARMEIDDINEMLPFDLPKGDYETLNGFILYHLGRIPKTGEKFRYNNLTFIIRKVHPRGVEEVEVSMEK